MELFPKGWKRFYIGLLLIFGLSQILILNQGSQGIEVAVLRGLYSLFMAIVVVFASLGSACYFFRMLEIDLDSDRSNLVFLIPLGMGILAYQILFLGLVGVLNPSAVTLVLGINLIISFFTSPGLPRIQPLEYFKTFWTKSKAATYPPYWIFIFVTCGIILTALFFALTPPWSPDALSYHLVGPDVFLETQRIILLPEVWGANGPFTIELLFLIGLSLQSEITSKVIHLCFALLLIGSVCTFGEKYLDHEIGLVSSIIFIAFPIFPIWASIAYVDMAWALFDFLSLFALINYFQQKQKNWLITSGVMMGFAMGSKYLALGGFAVALILIIWKKASQGFIKIIQDLLLFGSVSSLIAAPWYLKNWIMAGNPVYPFFWGGPQWNQNRLSWFMDFLHSFGLGTDFGSIWRIPADIYLNHGSYSTFMGSIEILSVLFPAVILILFFKRTEEINILLVTSILFFSVWVWGSQQIRFLLPIIPRLSLLSGYVLVNLQHTQHVRRIGKIIVHGLLGGVLFTTIIYSMIFWSALRPLPVILGSESRVSFLSRNVSNYRALDFVKSELPDQSKVMMLWDSESYYCGDKCWADSDHSRWSRLVANEDSPEEIAAVLKNQGVSHLMFNQDYANFVAGVDDSGLHFQALVYLNEQFAPRCLETLYQDEHTAVWELVCP